MSQRLPTGLWGYDRKAFAAALAQLRTTHRAEMDALEAEYAQLLADVRRLHEELSELERQVGAFRRRPPSGAGARLLSHPQAEVRSAPRPHPVGRWLRLDGAAGEGTEPTVRDEVRQEPSEGAKP
jgi:transposase